jgi:hypothetical protein
VEHTLARFGEIHGFIHAAGVVGAEVLRALALFDYLIKLNDCFIKSMSFKAIFD